MGQQVARAVGTPLGAVAGMLAAGVLAAISPAVAEAGWWSLAGLALAFLVASLTAVSLADLTAASGAQSAYLHVRERLGVVPGRLAGVLGLAGRIVAIGAVANMVTVYLAPTGSAGLFMILPICAAYLLHALGAGLSPRLWLTPAVVLIVTLGILVAVGLAIAPAEHLTISQSGVIGSNDATGILAAAGLLFFGFVGLDRQAGRGARSAVVAVAAAALGMLLVVIVALRQVGGPRLPLSPVPLRDLLAAADASSLDVLLMIGLAAGGVLALYFLLGGAMDFAFDMAETGELPKIGGRLGPGLPVAGVAGGVGIFVPAADAVAIAACLALVSYAFVNSAARSLCRAQRSTWVRTGCCGLALSVIVAVNISVVSLLSTVGVVLVGTLLCTLSARKADRA